MEKEKERFPYMELAAVVTVSALVTSGIFWVWHVVEMRSIMARNERDMREVRTNITILQEHMANMGVTDERSSE